MLRCTLHHVFTEPGVEVLGYGADGRLEVAPDGIVIGRSRFAEISIRAVIGGVRTFRVFWRDGWHFKVNNEWAVARINGELLAGRFPRRLLCDQDVVEIHAVTGTLVHRFGVEIA